MNEYEKPFLLVFLSFYLILCKVSSSKKHVF